MKFVQIIKKTANEHPFVCLLVVNMLFLALSVTILPFSYEGNDDRFLAWNTSGHLSGSPRCHIIWMNVIYAWFESRLYMMLPQIEWRSWLFLAIHLVCLTIMGYCLIKTKHNSWAKRIIIAMLYVWEMYNLIHFQFTTTAGLVATAGIILIVSKRKYGCGIALFLLGAIIRYQSAMFCGLMTATLYPLVIIRSGFDRKLFASLVLCMVGAVSLNIMDAYSYNKDSKLKEMRDYDLLRGRMYDDGNNWRVYDRPPNGLSRQEIIGTTQPIPYISDSVWTHREDYTGEYEFISVEKMELYLKTIEDYTSYKGIPGLKKIKNIPVKLHRFWMLFTIGIIMIVGCLFNCSNRKEIFALVFAMICFLFTNAYLISEYVYNVRAFLCGLFPLMWLSLILIQFRKKKSNLFVVMALSLTIVFFFKAMPTERPSHIYKQQMEMVKYGKTHNGKYLYSWNILLPEKGYPFGLRLIGLTKISPYTITAISDESLRNGEVVTLVHRNNPMEEINTIKRQFVDFLGVTIVPEKMCDNEKYILYKLKTDTCNVVQDIIR